MACFPILGCQHRLQLERLCCFVRDVEFCSEDEGCGAGDGKCDIVWTERKETDDFSHGDV